jgi:hypothetical protein
LAAIHRVYTLVNKDAVQENYTELVEYHKSTYTKLVSTEQQKQGIIWAEWIV